MTYISNFIYKFYLYSKYKTRNETRNKTENKKINKMKNNENSSKEELIKYSFFPCIF